MPISRSRLPSISDPRKVQRLALKEGVRVCNRKGFNSSVQWPKSGYANWVYSVSGPKTGPTNTENKAPLVHRNITVGKSLQSWKLPALHEGNVFPSFWYAFAATLHSFAMSLV